MMLASLEVRLADTSSQSRTSSATRVACALLKGQVVPLNLSCSCVLVLSMLLYNRAVYCKQGLGQVTLCKTAYPGTDTC